MNANCTRCSGRDSALAPTSSSVTGLPGTGIGIASAGRKMPLRPLDVEQARRERRARRAAGDERLRAILGDRARRLHDRGLGRRAHRDDGIGRLGDRHRRVDDLDAVGHVADRVGRAEQQHADALCRRDGGARGNLGRTEVRAGHIDGDCDGRTACHG